MTVGVLCLPHAAVNWSAVCGVGKNIVILCCCALMFYFYIFIFSTTKYKPSCQVKGGLSSVHFKVA